jgi:hypothetical protein
LLDVHGANVIIADMITPGSYACRLWRPMAYLGVRLDSNMRNFLAEQRKKVLSEVSTSNSETIGLQTIS